MPIMDLIKRLWAKPALANGNGRVRAAHTPEDPRFDVNSASAWDQLLEGTRDTVAGIPVSHLSALCHPTWWQAVKLISEDLGCLTFQVLRKVQGKEEMRPDPSHPSDFLIRMRPSEDKSSLDLVRMMGVHALTWGNGYAVIIRKPNGEADQLRNLMPDRTWPFRDSMGALWYKTLVDGVDHFIPAADMLHIRGIPYHGDEGLDPLVYHRDLIGMGQAGFAFASQFFRRGGRVGGVLTIPPHVDDEYVQNLEEGFRKTYESAVSAFLTVIAKEGSKFTAGQMSPEETQLIEARLADSRDIARVFNVPPQKLGIPDSVGFRSLEQSQLQYLQQALMPWAKQFIFQCRMRLLTDKQLRSGEYDIGVDTSSVLQLDEATLNGILEIQRRNAIITANQWRQRVGLPQIDDPTADELFNPNTMEFGTDDARAGVIQDVLARMFNKVLSDGQHKASDASEFVAWLGGAEAKHGPIARRALLPIANLIAGEHGAAVADKWTKLFCRITIGGYNALTEAPYLSLDLRANVDKHRSDVIQDVGTHARHFLTTALELIECHANQD